MASNAFRRLFGGEPDPAPPSSPGGAALSTAFLEVDGRFTALDEDVRTAAELDPNALVVRQWRTVLDRYSAATERYLWASGNRDGTRPPTPPDIVVATDELIGVRDVMDRFHRDHEAALSRARGARLGSAARVQAARVAAERATEHLAAPASAPHLGLRPVIEGTDRLAVAVRTLDGAAGVAAVDAAAAEVSEAAEALETALREAPGLADSASRAIASARTRLQAVRTRADGIDTVRSGLLREFSAACSADLVDNDRIAADEAAAADSALVAAEGALREDQPDQAHERIIAARDHLAAAGDAVDAVTERLRLLREVKADPAAYAGRTRFALRDAQLLAVQKGHIAQWGSVLDVQHERIERATAELDRVHPDYWGFVQTLADVDRTVDSATDRMRGRL